MRTFDELATWSEGKLRVEVMRLDEQRERINKLAINLRLKASSWPKTDLLTMIQDVADEICELSEV